MTTLDVFRGDDGAAKVVMTGTAEPPVVTNRASGEAVTLRPARIDNTGFTVGVCDAFGDRANGWWGDLPTDQEETDVPLLIEADGEVHHRTMRWARPPEPQPKKRGRRARSG